MTKLTNYALIGAGGYIAPRHLKAISETNGDLLLAYDINDSVGIMDSHFPDAKFSTEFEEFETQVHGLRREGKSIDYISICSPNYLHKSHSGFSLRIGANAICEKPLVLNVSDLDYLALLEKETGRRVFSILQLRLHPALMALKESIKASPKSKKHQVELTYITSRGSWYYSSWKGNNEKAGGIATNIGVHFFDLLHFLFGETLENIVHHRAPDAAAGVLELEQASVRWMLSINREHLPINAAAGQTTYRSITVDGNEIEFSGGFTDLHTESYRNILSGHGFGVEDVRPAIATTEFIRTAPLCPVSKSSHPVLSTL